MTANHQRFKELLQETKLILLTGTAFVDKKGFTQEIFQEQGQEATYFDLRNKRDEQSLTNALDGSLYEIFTKEKPVVLLEAQLFPRLNELVERLLSGAIQSTVVLSTSYDTNLDEVLLDVIRLHQWELNMEPLSFHEYAKEVGIPQADKSIEQRLIYGNLTEVVSHPEQAPELLQHALSRIPWTQFGAKERINKQDHLMKMLHFLAHRLGQPLSYNEIGEAVGVDNETALRYVELLSKAGILFVVQSYSNDYRYELKKSQIIYFTDLGIRNAILQNYTDPFLRFDLLELWKNWLLIERRKWNQQNQKEVEYYFWKTHTKQEVDWIEVSQDNLVGFKFQWDKKKKMKVPALFQQYYPHIPVQIINRASYWTFLTKK